MLLLPIVLLLPSKAPVDLDGIQFHSETKKSKKKNQKKKKIQKK
jgi:hypothetical protein